jgi:glycosyltransferase involved in cell wall biosynthesis
MKIAQVAPLWTSIPPIGYGGAEKIISLLTEELVKKNHDVTLFASGDSKTNAKLISGALNAPGLSKEAQTKIVNNMNHLYNMFLALESSSEFDIIHWHLSKDLAPLMFASQTKKPSIVTIHNHFYPEEMLEMQHIFDHFKNFKNCISISDYHQRYFPFKFLATIYNGINLNEFDFNPNPEDYMVWIGRFEAIKGVHLAIQAAIKTGKKLKIAAPKNDNDEFFIKEVLPYLNNPNIEYVGEVNPRERNELLKNAKVFLNPIQWDEPFGLVVPEANACGVPVIAYNHGAMKELINEGENGFIIDDDSFEEFLEKIENVYSLGENEYHKLRTNCRQKVEKNFTSQIMTDNYEKIYHKIA